MRDVKFRAWDKEGKRMIPSCSSMLNNGFFNLMQYTGLKDKNGKEIYEGDIICQFKGSEYETHYIVRWRDDHAGFWLYFKNEPHLDLNHYREKLEVIGNIYENPELTKEI